MMKKQRPDERGAGGTEGGRSPTGVPPAGESTTDVVSGGDSPPSLDPEVPQKATRRRFTAEYKARIVAEAEACAEPGEVGALLRRQGLYSSHLATWRRQRDEGALAGLVPKTRGRKPKRSPLERENEDLRREVERLREQLRQAELIIDVQKKVSQILGVPLDGTQKDETD